MTPEQQKIFDIQEPATRALLIAQWSRPVEEDEFYISKIRSTPIDLSAQCVKEDGTVDLNVRELSQEEAEFHNGIRYRRGSEIAARRGDTVISTLNDEKKERATDAFMAGLTLDAIKQKFKNIMRSMFKPSYAEIVAEEMKKRMK